MRAAVVALGSLFLIGCQTLLGFEPFRIPETDDGGTGAGGASGGESSGGAVSSGGHTGGSPQATRSGGAPSTAGGRSGAGAGTSVGGAPPGAGGSGAAGKCTPHCDGGQDSVQGRPCDGRGNFRCNDPEGQCNPRSGTCLGLDVDHTEVTMKAYLAWAATRPEWANPPEACAWKQDDFAPDAACMSSRASDVPCLLEAPAGCDAGAPGCLPRGVGLCKDSMLPIVCVDWCDAAAYCAAHHRRLCGNIRGGSVALSLATEPGESQWTNACSAGGQFTYASGNETPPLGTCTYNKADALYPAAEYDRCHSPSPGYAQFQDMSGNAAEWEDACAESTMPGKDDRCAVRGGSYVSPLAAISCVSLETRLRHETSYDLGFRCCG